MSFELLWKAEIELVEELLHGQSDEAFQGEWHSLAVKIVKALFQKDGR